MRFSLAGSGNISRSFTLGLITFGLLVSGMVALRGGMIALVIPFAVFLLVGFTFAPDEINLKVTRHLSAERVSPDQEVTVTLTITYRGSDLDEVVIEDVIPPGLKVRSGESRHLVRLTNDFSHTFTYRISGPRGGYEFEHVRVVIRDPMGVTSREVRVEAEGTLFIYPPLTKLQHVSIRPRRTKVYAGSIPARAGGTGTEFFGVREYQPGDSTRIINWHASAHSVDALYSNEFQQERVADVGIVLDGREITNTFAKGHSLFEHSVHAAAALADALLMQGNRVGLLVYATFLGWTFPGYGKIQRERILYSLAHAKPGGSEVFSGLEHLPARLFPSESQIILISPLLADDLGTLIQLRAQGYQVLLVSPNPVGFEMSYLPVDRNVELASRVVTLERKLLLQKVQHAGVQVLDWDVRESFDLAVKRKLSRPPGWLRAVGR